MVETVWLWLFPEFGSVVEEATEALFWIVPLQVYVEGTLKATVKFWLCPLTRVKLLQRMFPPFCTQEELDAPWLKTSPLGIGSCTATFVAVSGPSFVAVSV